MMCSPARELIESYLDGELEASRSAEIQDHLASCPDCSELKQRLEMLRAGIRGQAPYYEAPAHLQTRVLGALRPSVRTESPRRAPQWNWLAVAASLLLAVSLIANVWLLQSRNSGQDLIAREVLSSHVRSLIGTHLLDVPSSDRHTVKPWFNGKLDFAPDVKDLAGQGFPLIGGRVEYFDNRPVAALVYQRRQHVINLFTWPARSAAAGSEVKSENGYHLIRWTKGGMTYWAVSDLQQPELEQFVNLFQN
jgi:anti-sigma factor RsiW